MQLTRIMFPFLLLVALAAVAMGVLNTKGRFGIPASASTMFNVGSIVGGLLFAYLLSGGGWASPLNPNATPEPAAQWAIMGMAIGTLIGGGLQFLIQVPSLWQVGFRFRPVLSFTDPGVRQVMRLMGPAVIGTAAVQINVLINIFYASGISGGVSWLNYAFRLMQLPIGIFGVAIGTATLPAISRFAARNDIPSFRSTLSSSLGLVFLLTIPSACGLVALGRPIIALIYERGAFNALDDRHGRARARRLRRRAWPATPPSRCSRRPSTRSTTRARRWSSASSPSASTPSAATSCATGSAPSASRPRRRAGTPTPASRSPPPSSRSCNFFALVFFMRRRIQRLEGRRIVSSFVRIALASAALSAASYLSYRWLHAQLGSSTLPARLAEAFIPIAVGGAVFLLAAKLLRVQELEQAIRAFTARFSRPR